MLANIILTKSFCFRYKVYILAELWYLKIIVSKRKVSRRTITK